MRAAVQDFAPDGVIHLAAESHVDNSIAGPEAFLRANVDCTCYLLEALRELCQGQPNRLHHVSTDEGFGMLGQTGSFHEDTPYNPSSPYSATKAASEHLVRAWGHTYGLNYTISNCSNNFGPRQHDEKLIPTVIRSALA